MDCKEVQKNISLFLNEELSGKRAENFLHHIEVCPECREELSIQYLVKEGMNRLENGGSFDLSKDLDELIEESYRKLRTGRRSAWILYSLEVVAIIAVVFILVLVFLNK